MAPESETAPELRRPHIPTVKGSNIHNLGKGNLGRISAKYPFKKPSPGNGTDSNDNATGNMTGNTKEEISGSQSSENVGSQESKNNINNDEGDGNNNIEQVENNINNQGKNSSFNALISKFGGSGKARMSQQKEEPNESGGQSSTPMGDAKPSAAAPQSNLPSNVINGQAPNSPTPEIKESTSTSPTSKSKKIPSFLKKTMPKPLDRAAPQSKPSPANEHNQSFPADDANNTPKNSGGKKFPFMKQQSKQPPAPQSQPRTKPPQSKPLPQSRPNQPSRPQSSSRRPNKTHQLNYSQPRHKASKPSNLNLQQSNNNASSSTTLPKQNMVSPKSQQRLVLEQVAAQYFLSDNCNKARYVGCTDYGDGDMNSNLGGGGGAGGLGNIDENTDYATLGTGGGADSASKASSGTTPLGLSDKCMNKDRDALILFLEGNASARNSEDDDAAVPEDIKNLSIITEASSSSASSRKSDAELSLDIQRETNIDRILELASDHLSLGKNELALQAYRRAMKVAFADVLSVKQKLVEVKKKQANGNLDSSATELTKQQEQQFELSLLQVASRVADVHNNMGVVHEMNRHYEKARASYVDALEVYHNTCKRFEEKGDPDVDRTKKNVERMALACNSEKQRKTLHEKAARISRQVGKEKHFARRKSLLNEAIRTLKEALALEGETIGLTHPVAASTLVQIGKYHYEMREYDSAVLEIRQAITILRNALGVNHPQVGKSTLLLASIYERHGVDISPKGTNKEDSELELYVDALEPLKATLGEVHPEVGFLYTTIGYLYGKKGDLNLALLAYKASLKAYGEPSWFAVAGGVHPEVVSLWVRVTEHLADLKSWDEVLIAGRRALYLLRRLKNALFQGAHLSTSSKASTPVSSGASVTSQLPMPTAKSSKTSHIRITSDTYYDSLFSTLQSLGQAHTSLSNFQLARDACSESLQLAWEMALSTHGNAVSTKAKNESFANVIKALKRLGKTFLLEKHYAQALECFLPCLELLRSNNDQSETLDCASVLGSLGFLYLKLKKFTESSNFLRECLRLYQINGVDSNDRETRKIQAWLQMAESREEEVGATPPSFLEIPTIVFHEENENFA